MMSFINRFFSVEVLKETVQRFPLSVLCMIGIFVVALAEIHDIANLSDDTMGRLVLIASSLYLWFGISRLILESGQFKTTWVGVPLVVVASGLLLLFALSPLYWVHFSLVLPALLLAIVFAPYLSGDDDWSFWQFNRNLWLGVAISFLAAGLFCAGIMMALGAIDHLFGVDVPDELYSDIGLFAATILGPIYALSRVPKKFDYSEEKTEAPLGLRFIANWVSVPIVFIYLLILYAYFIKIVVSAEVPSGYLAYMITGFVGSGVLTYLIAWPLRGRAGGLPQLQLFYKIFFPALFVPIGFHFFAIWERVGAYGITEQRYVLILSAFWFLIIAIARSLPSIPLKVIPASLCVLLALSSFGPWGAVSVSGHSQFGRLESLLNKHGLLEDGHVVKLEEGREISFDDRLSLSSILDYMCSTDRDDMIESWFNVENKDDWFCYSNDLTEQLGFEYVYYRSSGSYDNARFYISPDRDEVIDVREYDFIIRDKSAYVHYSADEEGSDNNGAGSCGVTADDNDDKECGCQSNGSKHWSQNLKVADLYEGKLHFTGEELRVVIGDFEPIIINVVDVVKGKTGQNDVINDLNIVGNNIDLSYKIDFYHVSGEMKEGNPRPESITFDLLFKVRNPKAK